jgi:hypothetical protein
VTIILGGDSLLHNRKTPTSIPARRMGRRDVELSGGYDNSQKLTNHDHPSPVDM